jgi:uncharacterized protein DUF1236
MGDDMKFAFAGSLAAVLLASAANGQSAKLVIEPSHGKMIQEYVVTEQVQPVTVTVPLELGATVPDGIQLAPVPLGMVARVPEVRNYEYFTAGGKVVFVEPYTRHIVQIVQ